MLGDTTAEQGRHDEAAKLYRQAITRYGPTSEDGQRLEQRLQGSPADLLSTSLSRAVPAAMAALPITSARHEEKTLLSTVAEPRPANSANQPDVWEVRLGLYATEQQAEEIKERITRLLCPEPDHAPPCPVPWSALLLNGSDLDDAELYAELVEQARIEKAPTDVERLHVPRTDRSQPAEATNRVSTP